MKISQARQHELAWRPAAGTTRRTLVRRGGAAVAGMASMGVAGALVACGATGTNEAGEAKPATGAIAASGKVGYAVWGNNWSDGIEQKVIDAFHARNDKVKVELVKLQGNHLQTLITNIAAGDPPETALIDGYDVRAMVKRTMIQDVTARLQKDGIKKQDYVESWFDEFLYKGKYHYFPNMRGGNAAFFYNKNLIEKMGAKVPKEGWTLTDWLEISQKTTRDGSGRSPTQGGFDPASATFGTERPGLWWPFVWANGAELFDLQKNVCTLDSPAAIESLQFIQDLVHRHKVTRNSFEGVPGSSALFSQGKLAVVHQWFTNIPQYRAEATGFEWDVVVMPQGKQKKQVGLYKGNGQTIPVGSRNPDAAWEFMKFLGSYDAMIIYGTEGRFIPALKKANQDPQFAKSGKPPASMHVFTDPRVKTLPLMPEWNDFVREIWNPNLNKIWNNEAPAKEVLPEIVRLTNDLIKSREQY